jgi:hypothetical protein
VPEPIRPSGKLRPSPTMPSGQAPVTDVGRTRRLSRVVQDGPTKGTIARSSRGNGRKRLSTAESDFFPALPNSAQRRCSESAGKPSPSGAGVGTALLRPAVRVPRCPRAALVRSSSSDGRWKACAPSLAPIPQRQRMGRCPAEDQRPPAGTVARLQRSRGPHPSGRQRSGLLLLAPEMARQPVPGLKQPPYIAPRRRAAPPAARACRHNHPCPQQGISPDLPASRLRSWR